MIFALRPLFVVSLLMPFWAVSGQKPGEWPHSRGNEAMTGVSPVELKFPLEPAWQFKMMEKLKGQNDMLVGSPVVCAGQGLCGLQGREVLLRRSGDRQGGVEGGGEGRF